MIKYNDRKAGCQLGKTNHVPAKIRSKLKSSLKKAKKNSQLIVVKMVDSICDCYEVTAFPKQVPDRLYLAIVGLYTKKAGRPGRPTHVGHRIIRLIRIRRKSLNPFYAAASVPLVAMRYCAAIRLPISSTRYGGV